MYKASDKKLRDMLKDATVAVDEIPEQKPNIVELADQQHVEIISEFEETVLLVKVDS